jgi:type IV pilus assembly protein PilB
MEAHNLVPPTSTLHAMLKASLLFSGVDSADLELIASQMELMKFKKGDPIILEGEISDHVYFIKSGSVEIVKYRPELQQVIRVATLKSGAHFSEFSVLSHSNKSASAFVLEDAELYRLDGGNFLKVLTRLPAIGRHLVHLLAELNFNVIPESFVEYFDSSMIAHSPEVPGLLPLSLWKKFSVLPLNYHAGILLLAAKDPNQSEIFDFFKNSGTQAQLNMVLIGESDFESAFTQLNNLYTHGPVTHAAGDPSPIENESVKACLQRCQYFLDILEDGIDQLITVFECIAFKPGEIIFSPGEPSDYFYIIQSGRVEVSRPKAGKHGWSHLVRFDAREGLGEIPLLLDKVHTHRARATAPSQILRMKKEIFQQFLTSGLFCLNVSKVLARRLQHDTESSGLKFFDGSTKPDFTELGKLIPKQMMQQHQLIPLRLIENEITLGTVNPSNDALFSVAGRYLRGYRINIELITGENFRNWLAQITGAASKPALSVVLKSVANPANNGTALELNKLLANGFATRASDLHIEPTGTGYCVRYRVDGVLNEASKIPREQGETIVNRIKVLSQMDITNRMTPQDGQLKVTETGLEMNARVSTVPTRQGEGAVLRLIRNRSSAVPLSVLAPDTRMIKLLKTISRYKQGLFLVTGPTGSGKTTTLYSLINELNRVDVKIITLEDPIELEINGTTQIEINDKTGMTFARALRSTLRQDPDIMMVGEIRDEESAKIVFEAALSGHLVISTLHTNNAFAVKNRLKELGVPTGTMATGLVGAMAQRLVRSICRKCRVYQPISEAEKNLLTARLRKLKVPMELAVGKGCPICNLTGYHGRIPIMEVWQKTYAMEELILREASIEAMLECARTDGYDTLYEFGLKMVVNGLTTIEEVERCMAGATN